jgi:hypothetical protein
VYRAEWRMMSVAVKELKNLNVSESEIQQFLDEAEVILNEFSSLTD